METSYKEKYEQALRFATIYHKQGNENMKIMMETCFPELAKSEDEKVIKEIIELVMQPTWKTEEEFHRRNVLCAWLENVPVTIDHEKREGFHLGYKACLERQGEQKPEENKGNIGGISSDEAVLDALIRRLKGEDIHVSPHLAVECLKSIKSRVQPKQEWSEEEIEPIISDYLCGREHYGGMIGRLCHLKPKQKQTEWGEDDKAFLDDILCKLEHDLILNKDEKDWLKSLRPQNTYNPYKAVVESIAEMCKHYDKASHSGLRDFYDNVKVKCKEAQEYDKMFPQAQWKPSDEQIGLLQAIINEPKNAASESCQIVLREVLEQLKKLKEE